LPERFGRENVDATAIAKQFGIQEVPEFLAREWEQASPGERIGFILKTAWSDALDALNTWFDGPGEGKLTSIGEKVGRFIGEALMSIAGVEGQDIEDNVFYKMGRAAARGFAAGFKEEFDAGDFFGGLFSGDSVVGNLLMGYGALKLLPKILGGAGAGGGGAAAGAAGGGLMGFLRGLGLFGRIGAAAGGAATIGAFQEGAAQDFFSRILSTITFGAFGNANAGQGPGLGMGQQGPPNRQQILGGMTGGESVVSSMAGVFERSGQGIETGAETILQSGGRMQSAAATMFNAAVRLSNTRITVRGGSGGGGGSMIMAADGFEGTVTRPTLFMAGEGDGPEDVSIRPRGKGRPGSRGGGPNITFGDVHLSNGYDVKKLMADANREYRRAFGNG
jgi:hypothetical protein